MSRTPFDRALLNPDQRRHLETVCRLLGEDVERLAALPFPDSSERERLQGRLEAVSAAVARLVTSFDLAVTRTPAPRRRIRAIAAAWASDLGGMSAAKLQGYGPVHPDLATVLDPQIEELRRLLLEVADAAADRAPPA